MNSLWRRLVKEGEEETRSLLNELPEDIREQIQDIPITFEARPNAALAKEGIDPDETLGLFTGVAFPDSVAISERLPPQILLFLENIWYFADGDRMAFRQQVRQTLLHEIGHYLGLDEEDLDLRGLS